MICNKIIETHGELLKLASYEPGEKINKLLGDLVPLCTQNVDYNVAQQVRPYINEIADLDG